MNNVSVEGINKCTGCCVCFAVCPTHAISIRLNEEGFYRPVIDSEKCISCGKCKSVCYKYDDLSDLAEKEKIYCAAINSDKAVRAQSSSGGISDALASYLLERGYIIIGVSYDYRDNNAKHIVIEKQEDLRLIRGSKYFQNDASACFEYIKNNKDKEYAVFGLPCHIYGLRKFAGQLKIKDNFIFIDLYCHGIASVNLWTSYLKEMTVKYRLNKIDKIEFRSKAYGWHRFATKFYGDNKIYKSPRINDKFYTLFFSKLCFQQSCYNCKLRSTFNLSDIRLGDFWGKRYSQDSKGISVVAIDKQLFALNNIPNVKVLKEIDFSEAIEAQSFGKCYNVNEKLRGSILESLQAQDIKGAYGKYIKSLSFKQKVIHFIKNVFSYLPIGLTGLIKKVVR